MAKTNWKELVLQMVAGRTKVEQQLTLGQVLSEVAMADRRVSLAEFKAGMVELYEAGRIVLDDYTRAMTDIAGEPAVIEYHADAQRGYGFKWFVRGV